MKKLFYVFLGLLTSISFLGVLNASDLKSQTFWCYDGSNLTPCDQTLSILIPVGGTVTGNLDIDGNDILNVGEGYFSDGLVTAPSITWTSDTDSGLYRIGANNIGLSLNGVKTVDFSQNSFGILPGTINDGLITTKMTETTTADATQTNIFTLTLEDENTYQFTVDIIGVKSDGSQRATGKMTQTFYRTGGGGASAEGITTFHHRKVSDATWGAGDGAGVFGFSTNGNNIMVYVKGVAATTIKWSGIVNYINQSN